MDKRKKDWIKLGLLSGVGRVRSKILLREFHDPERVFSASWDELGRIEGIGPKLAKKIVSSKDSIDIDGEIKLIEEAGVEIITIEDALYPENLKHIYSPPTVLYLKGTLEPQDHYAIAIVGTRKASIYGKQNAENLSMQLVKRGFTVVSGLARGIDTSAHQAALGASGRTIAVLGSGINVAYPKENKILMEEISKSGAVISEFPMNTPPEKHNFPARNRIISGLSLGVIVVEAAKKSGALITASFALEEGREVFSVPGRIDDFRSKGTLGLIKEGAKLVEGVDDILEEVECPICLSPK